MKTIPVLFTRSRTLGSFAIRHWQHGEFSHVALVSPDQERIIEATLQHGVAPDSLKAAIARSSYHDIVDLPCPDPELAWIMAGTQIGKRYDWKAPIGVGLRSDFHDAERWDCCELVAWAIKHGGRDLFRLKDRFHRLKPMDLYLPIFD